MLERGKKDRDVIKIVGIDSLVPQDHLLRKIDQAVDFSRLYEIVEPLYCEDNGRPSVDPVVLFKIVLIQHLYGLPSLQRTAEEVSLNNAYRWFLGYSLQEETPHFSTVSYNFRHRFTEETVDQVFRWILEEVAQAGYHMFRERLRGKLEPTTSGHGSIDLIVPGCHKASGLKRLVSRWGITPEQCAAFGDGGNDIEMLRYCAHSYAMDNAPQNVKDAAKYVCPSNEEDGVLVTLEKLFDGAALI